jgi:hypothetical protein
MVWLDPKRTQKRIQNEIYDNQDDEAGWHVAIDDVLNVETTNFH